MILMKHKYTAKDGRIWYYNPNSSRKELYRNELSSLEHLIKKDKSLKEVNKLISYEKSLHKDKKPKKVKKTEYNRDLFESVFADNDLVKQYRKNLYLLWNTSQDIEIVSEEMVIICNVCCNEVKTGKLVTSFGLSKRDVYCPDCFEKDKANIENSEYLFDTEWCKKGDKIYSYAEFDSESYIQLVHEIW